MSIKVIKKEIDCEMSPLEASSLRSKIADIQDQISALNKQAENMLRELIENKSTKEINVIEETDNEKGFITEYYNGEIISQKATSKTINTEQKTKQSETPLAKSVPSPQDLAVMPVDVSYANGELDLLAPEVIDPDFEEDIDIFSAPV